MSASWGEAEEDLPAKPLKSVENDPNPTSGEVGARQDRWRHDEPERLRGLEIDNQLERGWLHDGQVSGLGTLKQLGRRLMSGAALFGETGNLLAVGRATWFIIDQVKLSKR